MLPVTWFWAGLAGVLLGLALGALLWRRQKVVEDAAPEPEPAQASVLPGMADVINVLRSSVVVLDDRDLVLQATSQARSLGLVRGDRMVVPVLQDLVGDVRADGRIRTTELELRRGRSSPSLYLSARIARVGDVVVILAEDRTAARRVEETRRDFVANVSHELKTPIGAMSLLAEAVEGAADDPDAVRMFASRIGRESVRLSELVQQIIELSRLQSDDPLRTPAATAVDTVLAEAIDRCRARAHARSVSLTLAGQRDLVVMGDQEQLATAVVNLVENAVIYSERGQKVVVAARCAADGDDRFVEIIVTDTGMGISAEDLPRIFERFYRVDYARSRDNGGTGLGLSIVKHIVAAHCGSVSVWSQRGQGSTFTIRIPESGRRAVEGEPGPAAPRPSEAGSGRAMRGAVLSEQSAPGEAPRPAQRKVSS